MNAQIHPAKPQQAHALSYHPQIRAVLKAGADKMWDVKDLMTLMGMDKRAVQRMLEGGVMASTHYPTAKVVLKPRRRVTAGSVLLYLVKNSTSVNETDALAALGVILDQMPSTTLNQLVAYLQKKLLRRATQPALVITAEDPRSASQMDLFTTHPTPPKP
jgi:hypothetical protein